MNVLIKDRIGLNILNYIDNSINGVEIFKT